DDGVEFPFPERQVDRTERMHARLTVCPGINPRDTAHFRVDRDGHGSRSNSRKREDHGRQLSWTPSLHFTGPLTSPMIWRPFTMLSMPSYSKVPSLQYLRALKFLMACSASASSIS